jgi:nucleoside-diphosphate-sugar epimerase
MTERTAFVTGATGFLGLHMVEQLLLAGFRVTALHRASSELRFLSRFVDGNALTLAVGDITERESLVRAMPEGCDGVFHVAANTNFWRGGNARQTLENVEGTRNVVEAALTKKARRLVLTSSCSVYGGQPVLPFDESVPQLGGSSRVNYERTKYLSEVEARAGIARGLDAVILNPTKILGKYDRTSWGRMILAVDAGMLPGVPPGKASFCSAVEVAKAHIAALERGKSGENYLLGGTDATYVEFVRLAGELTGKKVPKHATPLWLMWPVAVTLDLAARVTKRAPVLTPESLISLGHSPLVRGEKATRELGYQAVPLETMVRACYEWLVAEGILPRRA